MILEAAGLLHYRATPGRRPTRPPRPGTLSRPPPATHSSHTTSRSRLTSKSPFALAARETSEILYAPSEYDDGEVFGALADAIRPTWQVEPVEDATLEQLRTGTLAHDPFEKRFAHMHRWHRPA